ncbi:hypothetical protein K7432_012967 [Basidiobolus ranarum]|uniref:Thaumatin-like protein n=1 Tax=Basidiobolus ranarum TaxID=34480 RepID=A0ABR2VRG3_9FUNG
MNGGLFTPGESYTITVVDQWQSRVWGGSECDFTNKNMTTNTVCVTGDCGSGEEYDGHSLPISIQPHSKINNWGNPFSYGSPTVEKDINLICPEKLLLRDHDGKIVGCKSACDVFGSPQYPPNLASILLLPIF